MTKKYLWHLGGHFRCKEVWEEGSKGSVRGAISAGKLALGRQEGLKASRVHNVQCTRALSRSNRPFARSLGAGIDESRERRLEERAVETRDQCWNLDVIKVAPFAHSPFFHSLTHSLTHPRSEVGCCARACLTAPAALLPRDHLAHPLQVAKIVTQQLALRNGTSGGFVYYLLLSVHELSLICFIKLTL